MSSRDLSSVAPPDSLPARRADLIVRPIGDDGAHVVKDPRTSDYYRLGPEESFLLLGLGRYTTPQSLSAAFSRRFAQELSPDDLESFLDLARTSGFLEPEKDPGRTRLLRVADPPVPAEAPPQPPDAPMAPPAKPRQSILYWRTSIFDPDTLFTKMEPCLRFVWTRAFLAVSAAAIVAAAVLAWANRHEIISAFTGYWDAKVIFLVWLTLALTTTLHEFAHGLTCKHFRGEVHEVGFLLMFFIPCLYCNVSDAWLFRERSKRLLVTFAGGYWDLCLWAGAVFLWRFTAQDTLPNYLAWVILSVCGARIFFNLNPLLKLDGYYLLSDAIEMPNLRQRSTDALAGRARHLLWGAPMAPTRPPDTFLVAFGAATWVYSLLFLSLLFLGLTHFASNRWGVVGALGSIVAGAYIMRGCFQGFSSGEVTKMITSRRTRTLTWLLFIAVLLAGLLLIPKEERAAGSFEVRSAARYEVRAPVAGFLRTLGVREGTTLLANALVAVIEVPDLTERLAQKRAELAEGEQRLALAEAGPRVAAHDTGKELRVRAAERNLARATIARLTLELAQLEETERKQHVYCPIAGLVITPRLNEQIGRFVREGELICTIEGEASREIEVAVPEHDVARVREGQPVQVKVRAFPFETLQGVVMRTGAAAAPPPPGPGGLPGAGPSTVTVYCQLSSVPPGLRPGMTGSARIACGRRAAGSVIGASIMRYVRTEFW